MNSVTYIRLEEQNLTLLSRDCLISEPSLARDSVQKLQPTCSAASPSQITTMVCTLLNLRPQQQVTTRLKDR